MRNKYIGRTSPVTSQESFTAFKIPGNPTFKAKFSSGISNHQKSNEADAICNAILGITIPKVSPHISACEKDRAVKFGVSILDLMPFQSNPQVSL